MHMSENTSEQDAKHWKQKYYDQLDLLDKKENDWQGLESILKKAVLRLSIAAEGQHGSIDRHLHDLRSMVKKQVNVLRSLQNTRCCRSPERRACRHHPSKWSYTPCRSHRQMTRRRLSFRPTDSARHKPARRHREGRLAD